MTPMLVCTRRTIVCLGIIGCSLVRGAAAQEPAAAQSGSARAGAEFRIPLASLILPGLGQYIQGAWKPGLGMSAAFAGGVALYLAAASDDIESGELPRDAGDQLAGGGLFVASAASMLSAYDAFERQVPALQREGKYAFLTDHEPPGSLFTAPFDPEFLSRWTTWSHLAYTGVLVGLILSDRDAGVDYEPLEARDLAFATTLSLSAGIGEEAAFRGWLFPVLHQKLGERFWLSNGLQSVIFGVGHLPTAGPFTPVITAWAFYEGWLTRRNGWSVRESIFHHFWYDLAVVTAAFLTDRSEPVTVIFPAIRF